jgi:hypothetical protein
VVEGLKDHVLRIEASEGKDASKCQRTGSEQQKGAWHTTPKPAHLFHRHGVHGMNQRPRPKEEQGLEEGVCGEVKIARCHASGAQGGHHVPELGTGGKCQHFFDVVLNQCKTRR